jgi:hypothetical protein
MKPILSKASVDGALTATEPVNHKQIENQQIELRAYELYEQRGREDGHDVEDWLQAQAEVSAVQGAPSPIQSLAA